METKSLLWITIISIEIIVIFFLVITLLKTKTISNGIISEFFDKISNSNIKCGLEPVFGVFPHYFKKLDEYETPQNPISMCEEVTNDSILHVKLKPNCNLTSDGGVVKIRPFQIFTNSKGFRDREFNFSHSKDIFRIVAIGDSFTFGQGVSNEEAWPKILEQILNTNSNGSIKYEVLNFGIPGYNLKEYSIIVQEAIKYSPDLILIGYVGNDVIDNEEFRRIVKKLLENKNLTKGEVATIYSSVELELDEKIRSNVTLLRSVINTYFAKIFNTTRTIPVVIIDFYGGPKDLDLLDLSNKKNWYIFNIMPTFVAVAKARGYCRENLILHPLDPHPNALSHQIFGELIYEYLSSHDLLK